MPPAIPPVTVALDATGGYNADEILAAIAEASVHPSLYARHIYFMLVGPERELAKSLQSISHNPERISLVDAPDVVAMSESATRAMDQKPLNPVRVCCDLVAQRQADVVVSAGHPGLAVLSAQHHFTQLPSIARPALAAVYPQPTPPQEQGNRLSLLLDVGASFEADAKTLLDFARMGEAYARIIGRTVTPRVALLSTSRESLAGPPSVSEAYALLREQKEMHFIGMIEGQDIPRGVADVIVCSGFVGDVVIRLLEGVSEAAMDLARSAYATNFVYRQGLRLLSGGIKKVKQIVDFEEYGGAPLLGFEEPLIVVNPRAKKRAIQNAIKLAVRNVSEDFSLQLAQATAQRRRDASEEQ